MKKLLIPILLLMLICMPAFAMAIDNEKSLEDLETKYNMSITAPAGVIPDQQALQELEKELVKIRTESNVVKNKTCYITYGQSLATYGTKGGPYYDVNGSNVIVYYISWGSSGWYNGSVTDVYIQGASMAETRLLGGYIDIQNDSTGCSYQPVADVLLTYTFSIAGIPYIVKEQETWYGSITISLPPN